MWSVLQVLATAAVLGSALLAAVRALALDTGSFLALPLAVLPLVTVLTVPAVATLWAVRAHRTAALATALLLVELAWLLPRFVPDAGEPGVERLRVATVNAHVGGVDGAALVALVREQRVDVLAVQELTAGGVAALDAAGLRDALPYAELHPEQDSSLYSRLPLRDAGLRDLGTTWPQTGASVAFGGGVVDLLSVHTFYPLGDPTRWTRDVDALRAAAHPRLVLLGDLNATADHAPFRALLDAGLVDTHAELGRGWAPTWPAVPLAQLDHVLHGPDLVGVSVGEHRLPGTDHRAVVAELAPRISR